MFIDSSQFTVIRDISFLSKTTGTTTNVEGTKVAKSVSDANSYLCGLIPMFKKLDFDLFDILGQRNLSGFVGEVFVASLEKNLSGFIKNPHEDGRPDVIDIQTVNAKDYFWGTCFSKYEGKTLPLKTKLAPFYFGGIEVKASIGGHTQKTKKQFIDDTGLKNFKIGVSRRNYVKTITYWGHHRKCENLIGLYYDFVEEAGSAPQILAVMHSELEEADWTEVSIGRTGSKKTSNCHLTSQGKTKLIQSTIIKTSLTKYASTFDRLGLY
ncbi:hypothetical protein N9H65_02405 [Planktomarina temperata]|nr:hypothetical protein [Planktomarina temperata]